MDIHLKAIHVYPVKSLQGISLDRAAITPLGIQRDRLWVLVDEAGRFLSQRSHPQLARISTSLEDEIVHLASDGMPPLSLHAQQAQGPSLVSIWDDAVEALAGPLEGDAWFSSFLGVPSRLAFLGPGCQRPVSSSQSPPGHLVSFADAYPLLGLSQASLDFLNSKLEHPVPMDRFRANLIFEGCRPHAEDEWGLFQVGQAILRGVKPCPRCAVPMVDQATGTRPDPGEPLKTLASYRSRKDGVMFGMNLVVERPGSVACGDPVQILDEDIHFT